MSYFILLSSNVTIAPLLAVSYLTNGIAGLDRFPVSFRTIFNKAIYNHVVLGVYHNGCYGALGMSRRQDLMDKPLKFKVDSLIHAYKIYISANVAVICILNTIFRILITFSHGILMC